MSSIISKILSQIKENNRENVENLLYRLPIISLPKESIDQILGLFLTECKNSNNKELVILILSVFEETRSRVDDIPVSIGLITNVNLTKEVILFCFDCYPEKLHWEYYVDLLNIRDHTFALELAGKFDCYFNDITVDRWEFLYKISCKTEEDDDDEEINQYLKAFFEVKIKENKAEINKLEWIRDFPYEKLVEPSNNILSVKDAVNLLIKDIKNKNVTNSKDKKINVENDPSIREMLISQYAISTSLEKTKMLEHLIKLDKIDDSLLFKEFGPVNTIYTEHPEHLDKEHICVKYGGCRMFLCKEFEDMNFEGDNIDIMANEEYYNDIDWFRGKCDICLNKIPKRHYAIRQPLYHGGWKGCYCSFKCMESDTDEKDTYISLMIGRIKEQLNFIGIRDR